MTISAVGYLTMNVNGMAICAQTGHWDRSVGAPFANGLRAPVSGRRIYIAATVNASVIATDTARRQTAVTIPQKHVLANAEHLRHILIRVLPAVMNAFPGRDGHLEERLQQPHAAATIRANIIRI